MKDTSSSNRNLLILAGIVIVVLLALVGYLYQQGKTLTSENLQVTAELDETTRLKKELELQYEEALEDLESLRGENEALNQLIDNQKLEITGQKNKILSLLKKSDALGKARSEIENLTRQIELFKTEREKWALEKESLLAEKLVQDSINRALNLRLDASRQSNEDLSTLTRELSGEKSRLEGENNALTRKVNRASVIKADRISVKTLQKRDNGKSVSRRNADNVNLLEICFLPVPNPAASGDPEKFVVRILTPNGETLSLGQSGIAVFNHPDSGEEIQFTFETRELDVTVGAASSCFAWEPPAALIPGTYKVEVFNKAYLAGSGSFTLK